MDLFISALVVLIIACIILHFYTRQVQQQHKDPNYRGFQQIYLIVYLLAIAGDWLQGPHVYALYESYGIQKHEIEILFIAGFGSSMIFGTIVASLADKYGRRNSCLVYGILYGISCGTKHFPNFYILFIGRLLAGMATSILFSAFESWLINEHRRRNLEPETLGTIFANAYFGNSVVAIISGIVAQLVATNFGYVAPFDSAILSFIAMCILLITTWSENYGDANAAVSQSFISAWNAIKSDRKVFLLGTVQALFEGSMYIFVLEWTPALTGTLMASNIDKKDNQNPPIPHGYIFASYMVAMMMGSNSFKVLCNYATPESFMRSIVFISALCLSVPVFMPDAQITIFVAFLVFEFCVGVFWPAMATMRSKYVPEEARATVMNYFRIPLNFIVIIILLKDFPLNIIFISCAVFLVIAGASMTLLHRLTLNYVKQLPPIANILTIPQHSVKAGAIDDSNENQSHV
jgi:predicted MFS family arabinose efflux permease